MICFSNKTLYCGSISGGRPLTVLTMKSSLLMTTTPGDHNSLQLLNDMLQCHNIWINITGERFPVPAPLPLLAPRADSSLSCLCCLCQSKSMFSVRELKCWSILLWTSISRCFIIISSWFPRCSYQPQSVWWWCIYDNIGDHMIM